ncbi:MAG: hypothetical protein ACOYJR_02240 [Acutalibacteraceae bacterium]|jgi:hypothetical protein
MQLQEAQEIVRRACQILLITGGGILAYLGILKWRHPWGRRICVDAEILGFLVEHGGKGALSCPVVNLGEEGELRPAAVQSLKKRWRQLPGQTIPVCFAAGDFSHVTPAEQRGKKGFAAVQILCGAVVMLMFGLRLLGAG